MVSHEERVIQCSDRSIAVVVWVYHMSVILTSMLTTPGTEEQKNSVLSFNI